MTTAPTDARDTVAVYDAPDHAAAPAADRPGLRSDRPTGPLQKVLFGGLGAETTVGDVGLAILRVSVGLYIAAHGLGKLPPEQGFIGMTGGMGFPAPTLMAWMAGLTEFVGGLMVAAGLLTRWACLGLIFNMGVAAFVAHGSDPWMDAPGKPSKEMAMLYMFPFLALLFMGAGRFSVDALLRRTGRRETLETRAV